MKYCGVVYDVGLKFGDAGFSVEPFDPALVEYDMRTIAKDMHANAVRIEGEEIHRLATAARAAHSMGLTVFFNPWKMNEGIDGTCAYFEEAAKTAERLRNEGVDVIFVAGCEYTIFSKGIFPGESFIERAMWLGSQYPDGRMSEDIPQTLREKSVELNKVLRSFATVVRAKFNGPLTYSAGTWELVDWDIFDIVGIDYYRRGESKEQYVAGLERHRADKPLVVMEVGCCAYEGAADRGDGGDGGFMLLKSTNPDGSGVFEGDVIPTRSEREQADYLNTQLNLLATADVHAVFVYVFSFPCMRRGEGASDLDMMCFSLVQYYPEQDPRSNAMPPWSRKESFHQVADFFQSMLQPQV
ncbi:hypothetical protein E8E15_007718 [Penicillium rubens]|jgi:hypothetical protein|uniref:uncharacterized protein n=1 Tax=Penicillium rubens TaxID=1108849 RepID=UPI001D4D1C94|nr:uncharacterized protein N7525_001465 [Penicillium rubens]KAF3025300.1 hypothetical protein E8E15_007718 [Penicillium rubens]KAJ5034551.1 hypothetical protein NUH16_005990 [Penicillium rubens]KAJ5843724.1 hypothetical protein N7525_001465 [Penicillium rubens]